ncbi:acetyl-CoA synthetase-like protein [Gigaspora margarita]|uniref:Acetyl-CoA synthetase-like protein n=1 Tax=Gigaspora margarita TaxID=4874 RepID=A0A8H3XJC7_GIGMA|nr:acetyl-CoA synthetase-like protein [Gigaspora margarita]
MFSILNYLLSSGSTGGKVTPVNSSYKAVDLLYQLTDSGATVLIVHPEILEVAIEASIEAKIANSRILLFGDKEIKGYKPYHSVLINDREIEPIYYTPEEAKSTTAYFIYSSGTTGNPKSVELTHTNMTVRSAHVIGAESKLGPHSIIMGVTEFFHIYAMNRVIHTNLIRGVTSIILSSFSFETICESIQKFKVNHVYAVPSTILKFVDDPLAQQFDLSSVNAIISGGLPLNEKLERKFYEMFKIPIFQVYGLTESSTVLQYPDTTKNAIPGYAGILVPNMKAKILSEDRRELGYNEPGELWIHGPNIMKGYLNNKEATDAAFDKDGFFCTGDIAFVDEQGNFFIIGRKRDIIKYHDFYVAPSELESILLTHEAVSDAASFEYYSSHVSHHGIRNIPVAIVTGGNAGIDYITCKELARKNVHVLEKGRLPLKQSNPS